MKEFKVIIPDEEYELIEFKQDDLPGLAIINAGLRYFEPREVFSWHCSIMVELGDLVNNGMPSAKEREIVDEFGERLNDSIKGPNKEKPNALFLARITWNGKIELIWKVFDPELTNSYLADLIENKDYSRPFDYRIDPDDEWKLAEWHLKDHRIKET